MSEYTNAETGWLTNENKRIAESVAKWGAIAHLISDQGSSVVITHPGLDYRLEPCASVICHGKWTPPEGRVFTGKDHLEALSHAIEAFTEASR